MAKPTTLVVKLLSTAGTGFFYVTKKNPRTSTEKLEFRKYDPVVRKHVISRKRKSSKPASSTRMNESDCAARPISFPDCKRCRTGAVAPRGNRAAREY